ncbi:MAG: fumarylacetoacetate hydrolase family protein [Actinomycetota bacterium]|nr:fumarylacetoacetate hydrolase family protein [Actinomycetota bacterium]
MSDWNIARVVDELAAREAERRDGGRLTDEWPGLDLTTAYKAQDELLTRRIHKGERVVGVKLGLTSEAKQRRMGIDAPLTAWLTDAMVLSEGEAIQVNSLIHPRIEPEIAFVMGESLHGSGVTRDQALAAVRSVHAGFEVIDSRFRDFSFALPDVVADNASASVFVISAESLSPEALDLAAERCDLAVDGEIVDSATGAAVQGHPAEALALAANDLAARGHAIEAGSIVLTGGLTDAVLLGPGSEYSAAFTSLGTLTVKAT